MFNKNDPLISAVQEVMKRNHAEREAAKVVNEKFGVYDRKALPHEYQAEWDAVYKTVLTEGVEALDEASLPKPPTSVKAVKALGMNERRSRAKAHKAEAKKHKDVYDTHYQRGSHGTQTAQKALDRYTHHNDMADRYLNPSSHFQNEKNRERDFSDGGVKVYNEAKIDHPNKRKLDVAPPYGELTKKDFSTLRSMKEENLEEREMTSSEKKKEEKLKAKLDPSGMKASMQNQYGEEEGKNVYFATIRKKAMKENNEGFNNRHSLSVNASVQEQAVAEQAKARSDYGLGAIAAPKNAAQRRAALDASMEKGVDTVAPFIPGVGAARSIDKYSRGEQGLGQTAVDVGLNLAGGPLVKGAAKGLKYLRNLGKVKQKTNVIPRLSAPTQVKPTSQTTTVATNVAPKQTKPVSQVAREPDEIIPPKKPASQTGSAGIRGTFQDKLAKARQNAGSDLKARQLPTVRRTTEPTNYVRPSVPAVRPVASNAVTRPGTPNLAAGGKTRIVGLSPLGKATVAGVAGGAAMTGFAATKVGNEPPAAGADTGPEKIKTSTQTTGTPGKVTDRDIMNDPRYKAAVSKVGGEKGARKIGVGKTVEPVGQFSKGETIWSKVKGQLEKERSQPQTTTSVVGGQGIAGVPGGSAKPAPTPAPSAAKERTNFAGPPAGPATKPAASSHMASQETSGATQSKILPQRKSSGGGTGGGGGGGW